MNTGVIFLDIDGVLKDPYKEEWYQNSISLLNDYCSKSNVKIVISSDWRLHKNKKFFNNILNNNVIGLNKDLSSYYNNYVRYYECLDYAKRNKINNYVFLDDKPSLFLNTDRLIITEPLIGITFKEIFELDKILSSSPEFKQMSIFSDIEEIKY
jgi:hypothetical protein